MVNKQDTHKHKYDQRTFSPISKDGEVRYFLFRKCKCKDKYAYDLVREKPQKALA